MKCLKSECEISVLGLPPLNQIHFIRWFIFIFKQRCKITDVGWDGPDCEKLWRYNQHYFDCLNSIDCDKHSTQFLELVDDWITSNTPGIGVGWEPYPTSIRIIN